MAETQTSRAGARRVELVLAVGLSAAFVILAVSISPLVAALVVLPLSIAAGSWRASTQSGRTPHSLSPPAYSSQAVIHAPRVSASSEGTGASTAA